jgi:hypothetical protein
MKDKNSQRISGISTNQWRTLKLQRKLFIFREGEKWEDRFKNCKQLLELEY